MKNLIVTITASIMLATVAQATPFSKDPTTITEQGITRSITVAYYGQQNSNGTFRTNHVDGYYRSNGTHVDGYYRS